MAWNQRIPVSIRDFVLGPCGLGDISVVSCFFPIGTENLPGFRVELERAVAVE